MKDTPSASTLQRRKPATGSKATPKQKHHAGPTLAIKIDGEVRRVPLADLLVGDSVSNLERGCRRADKTPVVFLDDLLDYPERERWTVLEFITGLERYRVAVGESRFENIFDATLAVLVGNTDMKLYQRSKVAALEAAVLLYPEALEGASARIVGRLRELGVKGVRVADVLGDAHKLQKALQSRPAPVEVVERRVREIFPEAPIDEAVTVPAGWRLSPDGLKPAGEEGGGAAVSAPVFITERGRDVHRGTETVTLAWLRNGRWHKTVTERKVIANARMIVDLAASGLPVTSNNARMLVQYLDDFEAANLEHLPVVRVSHKMGWQGEDGVDGFLWGRHLVTADATPADGGAKHPVRFRGADEGDDQLADGFRAAGTLEGWVKAVKPLRHHPRALLGLYAAFVPPMLPILKTFNHVIDYAGQNTSGKTTVLRAVASAWGNPDERSGAAVLTTWHGTATWRERAPAVLNHLPFILDETKHVRFPEEVAKTIYGVVQGRGKGRGTVHGIAPQDYCETVLFSSGEQPATSFTRDGGTRPRVLSFWGSPFGAVSPQMAARIKKVNRGVRENYGHAGPRFVQYLLQHRDEWDQWRACYDDDVKYFENAAGDDAVAARMATHFAAITLTAYLVHEALDLPWEWNDPVVPVWDELVSMSGEADVAACALRLTLDWAVAHRQDFFPGKKDGLVQPHGGWVGRWDADRKDVPTEDGQPVKAPWIGVLPHVLERLLREGQFDYDAALRTWKERGWLETDPEGRHTKRTQIGGELVRVIALRRAAVAAVLEG